MIFGVGGSYVLVHSLLIPGVPASDPIRIYNAVDYFLTIPQVKEINFPNYILESDKNQQLPEPNYPSPRLCRFSDLSIQIVL